jgi:hypothetical protein
MKMTSVSSSPCAFVVSGVVSGRDLIVCSMALGMLFLLAPAFAQSDLATAAPAAQESAVAAPAENPENNAAAPATQDDNSAQRETQRAEPEAQGAKPEEQAPPILKSDQYSIPGKPSIPLSENPRLTFGDRAVLYRRAIFSPEILVGPAFAAAINQWRNEPPEWQQGGIGYGRRFGSGLARNIMSRTIASGFAAADGEDPRYIRSEDSGVWARTQHAIVWTFLTRRGSGTVMPAFSRFVGAYGAAFAANNWYPSGENNTTHAIRMGSTAIASSVGFHILAEFWPDIKRAIHIGSR